MIAVAQELALIFSKKKKKSLKNLRKGKHVSSLHVACATVNVLLEIVWKYSRKNKENKSKKMAHLNSNIYIWPFLNFSLEWDTGG